MQQRELKRLNDSGAISAVMVVKTSDYWLVTIDEGGIHFSTIRTARGGKREFKTLDAVSAMLAEVGIKNFTVN